ncbi:uncharacterized protein LOC141660325 [Apium graveolens]|uniref:uncharacterized protein LOC141660325 n=1 Tax=Apium graveolens TaxID=4045 RepID=UPI003D797150
MYCVQYATVIQRQHFISWWNVYMLYLLGLSSISLTQLEITPVADWFQLVTEQHNMEVIMNTCMVCWLLWKNRNDLIWNQRSMEVSEVVNSAYQFLNYWKSVQDRTFDRSMGFMNPEDGDEHLKVPHANSVKINTDVVIFEETNCYSFAFVVRDHVGNLVEARSRCLEGNPSPELAEALGIKEALSWVANADKRNVTVESDCLQVVQHIRGAVQGSTILGSVVQE